MTDKTTLQNHIVKPYYSDSVTHTRNTTDNIIDVVENGFVKSIPLARGAAYLFQGKNNLETAYNIWHYLRNYITYKKDGFPFQDVRLLNRFVFDGEGDCKSYSVFAASMLSALGFHVAFKCHKISIHIRN